MHHIRLVLFLTAAAGLSWVTGSRAAAPAAAPTPKPAAPVAAPAAVRPDTTGTAHVTYLSGPIVYIDAGTLEGLETGQDLIVFHAGQPVDTLKVEHLASHRASCSTAPAGPTPAVGDLVRFIPRHKPGPSPETAAGPGPAHRSPSGSWMRQFGLKGRVGVRHLALNDLNRSHGGLSQPSFDVKVDGTRLGGSDIDLCIDARSRQTYRTSTAGKSEREGYTRVQRMSLSAQGETSKLRLSVGRQFSASLAPVSLFDGLLAECLGSRLAAGLFAGSQPEPINLGYSRDIMEYGFYTRYQNTTTGPRRWSVTGGGISSNAHGLANRDYLFLTALYGDDHLNGYAAEEIDINRGWKLAAGESRLSLTSTLASLQYRFSNWASVRASYDDRRNPRLYTDHDTPETEFDMAHRQGWGGGAMLRFHSQYTVTADYRSSDASSGALNSYTATFRAERLTPLHLDLGSRHTRYTSGITSGWLHSGTLGGGVGSRRLDLNGGLRSETPRQEAAPRVLTRWYGTDVEWGVARSLFLLVSFSATRGNSENNDQLYSSLSYLF